MACERCLTLMEEIERIKEAARTDLQSAHTDLVSKNRQLAQARKELAKYREEQPESSDVTDVLKHWKEALGKQNRTDIGPGGKRYKIAETAVKRWGKERCIAAVNGLASVPYAGPRGRSREPYAGAKRWDDIQYALGDEIRFETMELLGENYQPEPELTWPELVRMAKEDAKRKGTLFSQGKYSKGVRQPIPQFLGVLGEKGQRWQAFGREGVDEFWMATCPAHEDRSPSLKISEGDDGRVLLHCHAGCSIEAILEALGLDWSALWRAEGVAA